MHTRAIPTLGSFCRSHSDEVVGQMSSLACQYTNVGRWPTVLIYDPRARMVFRYF